MTVTPTFKFRGVTLLKPTKFIKYFGSVTCTLIGSLWVQKKILIA